MNEFEHYYTIQQLSDTLNIPKPTLRFWEKELNGILVPLRTPGGQRRYSAENLNVIMRISKLRKTGMSIPEIRRVLDSRSESSQYAGNPGDIDHLAEKITEVVKGEIFKFLNSKNGKEIDELMAYFSNNFSAKEQK
ncbi:MAG: MerR family transcriptional regulator [Deltaproteobacteria bacterium]|jgi:DNA-binding transcriptional MerR regulator|nr:MerR family transcriptional regulator [Deltaproteobacteria bacterium]